MSDHLSLFNQKLKTMYEVFLKMYNLSVDFPSDFSFYQPDENKSFGSTSNSTFNQIKEIARSDGFFCDPIYNAKLFIKAKSIIMEKKLEGLGLIIQSGGTFSLMGFDDKL
jgi:1-aminocyclopropane-1-carboxylate deaminase/D-cysteine desulfhydrase-like pyridoxal-dependent ACC family enzyme